ncbi:MAG: hypothetical protein ABSA31_01475 [Acidimicrobiales bacterium]
MSEPIVPIAQGIRGDKPSRRHRHRRTPRVGRRGRTAAALLTLAALGVAVSVPQAVVTGRHIASPVRPVGSVAASGWREAIRVVTTAVVPGAAPVLRWPEAGQAAVAVRGVGIVGRSPAERPVPIASLTKMMTAYVVLHDHPLKPGESGPDIRVTRFDVATFGAEEMAGDSTVKVVAGEILSERQLLEALLIPSGDNIAVMLADWDAGSVWRFVAKMNATARSLRLASTHYADVSGVDPASVSTAADQARLASDLMGSAVIRGIVRRADLPFPVVRSIWNANPAIGVDGIQGVKSGWTLEAKGCLVTAAFRTLHHQGVLVVSAALGQPDGLWGAAQVDEALLDATTDGLVAYRVVAPGATVVTIALRHGNASVSLVAPRRASFVVVWHGLRLTERVSTRTGVSPTDLAGEPAGSDVGSLSVVAPWGVVAELPLLLVVTP